MTDTELVDIAFEGSETGPKGTNIFHDKRPEKHQTEKSFKLVARPDIWGPVLLGGPPKLFGPPIRGPWFPKLLGGPMGP